MEEHNYFVVGERTHRVHASRQLGNDFDETSMTAARQEAGNNSLLWCAENESYFRQDFYIIRAPLATLVELNIAHKESGMIKTELAS